MREVKNIVFDMGGVLIDLDREACVRAFEELGYHEASKLLDPYHQRGMFLQLERGDITADEFRSQIRVVVGDDVNDQQIDDALSRFLVCIPSEKLELLRDLHKRYNVYMLSNTNPIMLDYIDRTYFNANGFEVSDYFNYRYLSCEMKMMKPNDDIYLAMASHGGMNPEETLFLDDSLKNIEAAQKLGFQVYLVGGQEDLRPFFESY